MVSQVGAAKDAAGWIYEFTLTAGPGHSVALAGSFNDWDPDTAPMKDADGSGCYRCTGSLQAGSSTSSSLTTNGFSMRKIRISLPMISVR